MASKPTPKKGATKKSAPAKPAAKAATPAKKAAKPASKPVSKPAAKAATMPTSDPVFIAKAPELPQAPTPKPVPVAKAAAPASVALTISVQTSQGTAASGNTHPANMLVIVTCAGAPVVELTRDHFTLMEHFEVPGQTAPFSNSITSFRNAGTGAYLLQTKPITGAPWRSGHHLGQLLVSDDDERQGQAAFKLIIK
jgi:hypothetical protein